MRYYLFMITADVLLTLASISFAMMLRLEIFFEGGALFGYFLRAMWPFILFVVVVRPTAFYLSGVYRRVWRYAAAPDYLHFVAAVTGGSVVITGFSLVALHFGWMSIFPRSLLVLEGLLSLFLLGGLRVVLKFSEQYTGDIDWRKVKLNPAKRVLIVGAGYAGVSITRELLANPQLGLHPVAFLDDDSKKIGRRVHGIPVFGPLVKVTDVAKAQNVDEVIVAMPSAPEQTLQGITGACGACGLPVSTMPFLSSFMDRMTDKPSSNGFHVPMALPHITGEEIRAVVRVVQSRNLSIGSQNVAFEKLAAEVAGTHHAVSVINGTSALHLCMVAAGIGPGDEVITTPFSFVASANCVLYERAVPVFVDIDPVTLNIDPAAIEAAVTERTRAIIPVHVFGQPADMEPILEIARKHNLVVIEDACEAIGAEYKGRRVGALGKAGAFAFYPNKQMTTGEGAVLVTNDEEWAHIFRSLRNQGRDRFDGWLNHSRLGYNYRLSEMNAALGVVQMKHLDEILAKRDEVAREYNRCLAGLDGVTPLAMAPGTTRMSWFVYTVRFSERFDRNRIIALLAERGIPSRPYFTPIHLQPFYRERFRYGPGDFPKTERAGESILALPFYTDLKKEEVERVCEVLRQVLEEGEWSADAR